MRLINNFEERALKAMFKDLKKLRKKAKLPNGIEELLDFLKKWLK